jgi:ribosome maturation factor RimP
MDKLSITEKVNEIAEKTATKNHLELVRAEVVGSAKQPIVRIYIDKPEGITHDDCSKVSHEVGAFLDEQDFISQEYTLEVSSPGLERELYSLKDFEKFAGSLAKVRTKYAIDKQRNFRGKIKAVENEEIVFDDKTNGEVRFPYEAVAKANLEIDLEEEFKRGAGTALES